MPLTKELDRADEQFNALRDRLRRRDLFMLRLWIVFIVIVLLLLPTGLLIWMVTR